MNKKKQLYIRLVLFLTVSTLLLIISLYSINLYYKERKQLEETTIYFYNSVIENPLYIITYFLGLSIDKPNWDNQIFRKEYRLLLHNLDKGITHISSSTADINLRIPESIILLIKLLKEKNKQHIIYDESPVSEELKQKIVAWSIQIHNCLGDNYSNNWEEAQEVLGCLLN